MLLVGESMKNALRPKGGCPRMRCDFFGTNVYFVADEESSELDYETMERADS